MDPGIDIASYRKKTNTAFIGTRKMPTGYTKTKFEWKEILTRDIQFPGTSLLKDKNREEFYLELSTLLEAGVDIKTCLELITEEQSKLAIRQLFSQIGECVIKGQPFSEAVKSTGQFSNYEIFSLQIGEESGKINSVLKELAGFYTKKIRQHRQVMSALSYPIVVLLTAFGAVFFMITFVIPMFAGIFKRFGGDLPIITKVVLNTSEVIKWSIPYILTLVGCFFMIIFYCRKKIWYRKLATAVLLRIPLLGDIMLKIHLARFSYAMTLLISSRVPILRSITMINKMIAFYPIELSLNDIEKQILQGTPLYQAMASHKIYPKKMVSLIKVGEEVNQLDIFFDKIAKQYNDEVEYKTAILSSVIEPILIIFLGLIVGTILISMYLPLFKLGSTL